VNIVHEVNARLKRGAKALAEQTFGIHISRTPHTPPNKHADHVLRNLRRWSPADVMIDVGANDGRTILRLQHQLASPRIFAFEPVAATYAELVERTSHLPNVRAFQAALGATEERRPIYLNDIAAMNSFSPQWTPQPTGTELVDIQTIDSVMAREQLSLVHFLKIDTEGFELEVLKGAERALAQRRIAIIQVEVGVGQIPKDFLSLEMAREYLAPRGYRLQGIYNQCTTTAAPPLAWGEPPRAHAGRVVR
jgi:FkbM family methyltransferase